MTYVVLVILLGFRTTVRQFLILFKLFVNFLPVYQIHAVGTNLDIAAINFGVKVEKLFEKVKKAIDKGETNRIVNYMFDIKTEIE